MWQGNGIEREENTTNDEKYVKNISNSQEYVTRGNAN